MGSVIITDKTFIDDFVEGQNMMKCHLICLGWKMVWIFLMSVFHHFIYYLSFYILEIGLLIWQISYRNVFLY